MERRCAILGYGSRARNLVTHHIWQLRGDIVCARGIIIDILHIGNLVFYISGTRNRERQASFVTYSYAIYRDWTRFLSKIPARKRFSAKVPFGVLCPRFARAHVLSSLSRREIPFNSASRCTTAPGDMCVCALWIKYFSWTQKFYIERIAEILENEHTQRSAFRGRGIRIECKTLHARREFGFKICF